MSLDQVASIARDILAALLERRKAAAGKICFRLADNESPQQILRRNPYSCGVPHPLIRDNGFVGLAESPIEQSTNNICTYEIDAKRGRVILWSFYQQK